MRQIILMSFLIFLLSNFGDFHINRHTGLDSKETYASILIKGQRRKERYRETYRVRIITDPQDILAIKRKPVTAGGYVIEGFEPLPYPKDFTFYDINVDGRITIKELIKVTGEAENMELAFEATDVNRDGYVTREEFDKTPWGLDMT